ncbi:ORF2 [European roller astrovirus]|nr:ORF2 [European roller astrovirus]
MSGQAPKQQRPTPTPRRNRRAVATSAQAQGAGGAHAPGTDGVSVPVGRGKKNSPKQRQPFNKMPKAFNPQTAVNKARVKSEIKKKDTAEVQIKDLIMKWTPKLQAPVFIEEIAVPTRTTFNKTIANTWGHDVDLTIVCMPGYNTPIYYDVTPSSSPFAISGVGGPIPTTVSVASGNPGDDGSQVFARKWYESYENAMNRNGEKGEVKTGVATNDVVQAYAVRTKCKISCDVANITAQGRVYAGVYNYKIRALPHPNGVPAGPDSDVWSKAAPYGGGTFTANSPPIPVQNYTMQLPCNKSSFQEWASANGLAVDVSDSWDTFMEFSPNIVDREYMAPATNTGNAAKTNVQTVANTTNLADQAIWPAPAVPPGVTVQNYIPRIAPSQNDSMCFINDDSSDPSGFLQAPRMRCSFDQQNTLGLPFYFDRCTTTTDKVGIYQWVGMPPGAKATLSYWRMDEVVPERNSAAANFTKSKTQRTDPDDVFALCRDSVYGRKPK